MDDKQRLQLQNMIKANDTFDYTESIRELKHSNTIREDVNTLMMLKVQFRNNPDELHLEAAKQCTFLFTFYTDLYNKIRKDELDLKILFTFLDCLQEIEEGTLDQHEASFKVGTLLKQLYIDSAIKKSNKLDNGEETIEKTNRSVVNNISWKDYKKTL